MRNTKKGMEKKMVTVALWIIQLVYLSVVFYFTVISRELSDEYKMELMPLKTIVDILHVDYDSHGQYILRQVLLNIGLLMPVGFILGFLSTWLKNDVCIRKVILFGFLTSLSIETLQLISKTGTFEVDDLIYNTLGCTIGYFVCTGILSVCLQRENKTKPLKINNQTKYVRFNNHHPHLQ
ncbi:Glycopeptide antibiotics resistance protein [Prevotella sp. khp1]|nr:Glycopeptide antibiotics resistance protein [Prevotella sp. khp1]